MHLKISDPNNYPFGLLSIHHRQYGSVDTIADLAVKAATPPTLELNLPLFQDVSYFPTVMDNFKNSLENFILKHASEAAIHRIKTFFLKDIATIKTFPDIESHNIYSQQLAWLINSPIDAFAGKVVDVNKLARIVEAVLAELLKGTLVENGTFEELEARYVNAPHIPTTLQNIHLITDVNKIVEQLKAATEDIRFMSIKRHIKETLLDKYMDKTLKAEYSWVDESQYPQIKAEQLLRNYTGRLEEKLFMLWLKGKIPPKTISLPKESLELVLSRELFSDSTTGKGVPRELLAVVVENVLKDLIDLKHVPELRWVDLVKKYYKPQQTINLENLKHITDVNTIVETLKNRTFPLRRRKLIGKIKKLLLQQYLLKPKNFSIEAGAGFRNTPGDIDERLFQLWYQNKIRVRLTDDIPGDLIQELLYTKPQHRPGDLVQELLKPQSFTFLFTELEPIKPLRKFFSDFPQLKLSFEKPFTYNGGIYRSPLEYGYRKAIALFEPYLAAKTKTKLLPNVLRETIMVKFIHNVRYALQELLLQHCYNPYIWTLFSKCQTLEWNKFAGFVEKDWLSQLYTNIKHHIRRNDHELQKPIFSGDLTTDPLVKLWFLQRVKMWKPVAVAHKKLFLLLTNKFIKPVRFPTAAEKHYMSGCDVEVWQVIYSEFVTNFKGTKLTTYNAIINEVTQRLPFAPSFGKLCKFFEPIYSQNPMGYLSVDDMVKGILGDWNDYTLIILWTRVFLK